MENGSAPVTVGERFESEDRMKGVALHICFQVSSRFKMKAVDQDLTKTRAPQGFKGLVESESGPRTYILYMYKFLNA